MHSGEAALLARGTQIAGYRVEGVLGKGGMGVVYEATQLSLERTVALKLLARELSEDFSFLERFRREGLLQAALDHPHIVSVYEAGESEHGLFLAMRLIRGPDLRQMIVAGELDTPKAVRLLSQVAGALDEAHSMGLVHRDIKPSNILVDGRGEHAYLADFGVTRARDRTQLTKTGQFVGTLDYIAPEQINGQVATERTDIYALGAVIFEAFTGSVPFPRDTEVAAMYAHLSEPPPSLTEKRPDLPEQLDEVLARALAKVPDERHASAGELLHDVQRLLGDTPRGAARPREPETALAGHEATRPAGRDTVAQHDGDGLDADFPPWRTLEPPPTNLPIQLTPLVGREAELRELAELLAREDVRLLTLCGPGGTGKTRLALQVAAELVERFPEGVYFVSLATLVDSALVLPAVAQTLGLREQQGQQLGETLRAHLSDKRILLLVDNFEQVLEAAPELRTLVTATVVKLVVTSRSALRLSGEHVYAVSPLPLPGGSTERSAATLSQCDSVRLFVERASAAKVGFALTD